MAVKRPLWQVLLVLMSGLPGMSSAVVVAACRLLGHGEPEVRRQRSLRFEKNCRIHGGGSSPATSVRAASSSLAAT